MRAFATAARAERKALHPNATYSVATYSLLALVLAVARGTATLASAYGRDPNKNGRESTPFS